MKEVRGLSCAVCGMELRLRQDEYGLRYLQDGSCSRRPCAGSLAAHPDGSPTGWPADLATKGLRVEAHEIFDRLWKIGDMNRSQAYAWLASRLDLPPEKAHIGMFDAEQCRRTVALVRSEFPELFIQLDLV